MKLARLRMRWRGDRPLVGHFLKTANGRTAYEVGEIRVTWAGIGGLSHFVAECTRWPAGEIPEHATVHQFAWDKRMPPDRRRFKAAA